MELLGVVGFIGGWVVLGLLAHRFGHDSRPSIGDPAFGSLAGRADGSADSPLRVSSLRVRLSTLTSRAPSLAQWQMPALARRPAPDPRIASKLSLQPVRPEDSSCASVPATSVFLSEAKDLGLPLNVYPRTQDISYLLRQCTDTPFVSF